MDATFRLHKARYFFFLGGGWGWRAWGKPTDKISVLLFGVEGGLEPDCKE